MPTFEMFKTLCSGIIAVAPACRRWSLEFAQLDFQREWQVKIWAAGLSTFETFYPRSFVPEMLPPALAHAARVLRELETGSVDESVYERFVLNELRALSSKVVVGATVAKGSP